ncbi:MAG: 4-hydroxy-tetrahydrodipicolinate synthase [Spirochaetales bacterium]
MFEGVYTALITPFAGNGAVDEDRLRALVDAQISGGVEGLVPVGTTGESPTVTHDENIRIIEIVCEQAAGRVPVIAGTGSNSTSESIDMTRKAREVGATATLQVSPYYNKPSQEGLRRHFTAVADEGGLPVVIYNIPGRTGKNIENDTMLQLAAHPNIVAVKEASGSMAQVMELIHAKPDDFGVLAGDDNLSFPITMLGGSGVISVASNIIPGRMSSMIAAALAGEVKDARRQFYELLPLFRSMFLDTNPIPVKYAMTSLGYCEEIYRLPMCELSDENKRTLDGVLDMLGLI